MIIRLFALAVGWLSICTATTAQTLAFPGAEGFGRFAAGARTSLASSTVYHVTNLNDSGAGSFRDAVSQPNRFVVFDVGGIIHIPRDNSVVVVQDNVTIAGQTAPGGIVIYGNRVSYSGANNTITRYLGVHKGEAGYRDDAVGVANGVNLMFDHMSVTWGVDETFSLNWDGKGSGLDNITIQDSIIAQGQDRLGHSAGGLMTLPEGSRLSILRSIFADNVTRNPKIRGENEFINNVVYGWQTAGYIMGDTTSMDSHANIIGNYFIESTVNPGGNTALASGTPNFHVYGSDNWIDTNRDGLLNGAPANYPGADVVATPFAFPSTASMTAAQAVNYVAENAGLSIIRDVVDARIEQEIKSLGTLGGIIQRETDLFPNYVSDPIYLNPRARFTDADNDGIADNWETAKGLSPANSADWKNLSGAGYTQLEEYVNELGAKGVTRSSAGGAWSLGSNWGGFLPTLADDAVATGDLSVAAGTIGFARRLTLSGNLNITGGTVDVFDTTAVSTGAVTISGGTATFGQLLLGAVSQTASLTLSTGGTLQSSTISANGGAATFNWNGGTLRTTGPGKITLPTTLGASGGTLDTTTLNAVYSGQISGNGTLNKAGAGTLTLSAPNTYAGGTTIGTTAFAGNLKLAHNTAAGSGTISVALSGGTVQLAHGVTIANNISTNYSFDVLDVVDANATATYAGNLTRVGSKQVRIRTTGAGATLNITGSITAPSGFYFSQGNVVVANTGSITGGGGAAVGRGGTVSLTLRDSANFNVGGFSMGGGQAMPTGTITVLNSATLSTGASNLDLLSTTSATALSELNLDGGATIVGGFVKSSVGATQTTKIDFNGGTLKYGGAAANASFLPALNGLVANVQTGGAKIDSSGQDITITQPLVHDAALATADGGLTKLGAGTLILAGSNTYNGPTTVSSGALRVNGNLATSSVVTVNSATLSGTGAIGGSVTINNGGRLAPGTGIESLDVGALTLTPGAILEIELNTVAGVDQSDLVNVLNPNGLTVNGGLINLTNFAGMTTGVYKLIDYQGALTGSVSNLSIATAPAGFNYSLVNNTSGTSIDLLVAPVLLGDYNNDGAVDAADYTRWRDNLGASVTLPNDATPGSVVQADYDVWQSYFGATLSSASAASSVVPEPAALMLLLGGALLARQRGAGHRRQFPVTASHTSP